MSAAPIDHSAIPETATEAVECKVVKETKETKTGAAIVPKGDALFVSKDVPMGTPARAAGLMKGDYITSVDGQEGYLSQLVEAMGAKEGEMVLGVSRGDASCALCVFAFDSL